jgi:hypothetical protein
MSARSTDRKYFVAMSSYDYGLVSNMSADHSTVGYVADWDSLLEIRPRRRGLVGAHFLILVFMVAPVSLAASAEYVKQVFDLLRKFDPTPTFIKCTGTPSSF